MFCMNCGRQLPDDAKFCSNCGKTLLPSHNDNTIKMDTGSKTKLVQAKCTGCGSTLEVDPQENAAICKYCNSAYVVEQAIKSNNIKTDGDVHGTNVDNLLIRAKDFEQKNDFNNALNYYNQVLDIDFNKQEAHDGIKSVKAAIENYIYFQSNASLTFSSGILQLKKNRLIYISKKNEEQIYYLDQITNLKKSFGTVIQFEYPKKFSGVSFGIMGKEANEWVGVLTSAIKGIYPGVEEKIEITGSTILLGNTLVSESDMDRITGLINRGKKIDAIKLVRTLSGLGLREAKDLVDGMNV